MSKQFGLLVISIFLIACGIKKESTNNNVFKPDSAKSLIASVEANNKSPNWLLLKGKINLEKDGQSIKFSTDIRIRKDSVLWMSIKGPFGIELFRALLTTDSIYFLNISKSTYIKAPISYLYEHFKTEIDFMQTQQIFFGAINIPKAKYTFSESTTHYKILSKNRNKKLFAFLVEKQNFRIVDAKYHNSENEVFNFSIRDYYKVAEGFLIPKNLKLDINATDNFSSELNFTKIICNKKQKIHFTIPDHYVKTK